MVVEKRECLVGCSDGQDSHCGEGTFLGWIMRNLLVCLKMLLNNDPFPVGMWIRMQSSGLGLSGVGENQG